jgi:hypothetical protein
MKRFLAILMVVSLTCFSASRIAIAGQELKAAESACKKVLRTDKWLENLGNQTLCYQAAVQGSPYARKMLHRSSFLVETVLRLYLDVAIPAATLSLELTTSERRRLQRQQTKFWRSKKDSDFDLLFLQDNAGLPYRFSKATQKGKIAEVIVHFQKGLGTNTESAPQAPAAGRYLLRKPNKTWLIDDFEPVRMELDIIQRGLWLGDYVSYARSAYGNVIDLGFIALANKAGLSHFWLTGESGQDADFLRRNHGKGLRVEPYQTTSSSGDSESGTVINIGFLEKESDAPSASSVADPLERAQYQIVQRDGRWFIASFQKIGSSQSGSVETDNDEQWIFENPASVAKYLSQSQILGKNMKTCEPSEFTFSVPTIPAKKLQFIIQGSEGALCRFKVMVVGAIGALCRAPAKAVDALLAMERYWAEQLQTHRDGPFPLRLTADQEFADKVGQAMAESCKLTIDEQPPVEMEKYINDTFAYVKSLNSCTPHTYTYSHPIIPGFMGKNIIQGYEGNKCLIQIHMPGDIIMECKASSRHVELLRNQTAQMLKDLQETGKYESSIKIDLGSGISSSELSELMGKECKW